MIAAARRCTVRVSDRGAEGPSRIRRKPIRGSADAAEDIRSAGVREGRPISVDQQQNSGNMRPRVEPPGEASVAPASGRRGLVAGTSAALPACAGDRIPVIGRDVRQRYKLVVFGSNDRILPGLAGAGIPGAAGHPSPTEPTRFAAVTAARSRTARAILRGPTPIDLTSDGAPMPALAEQPWRIP